MRTHLAALTLLGENFPKFAIQPLQGETSSGADSAGSTLSPVPLRSRAQTGLPPTLPRRLLGSAPPAHFLLGSVPRRRSGAAPAADTQRRMMRVCIAVLLVLQSLPGKAELQDDMEEIAQDLYDYMAHLSNYYSSTEDYYYDNITATPATYVYEFDSYEANTIGYVDWDKLFPEENATTKVPEVPNTKAPGDSRDAKDSQDFQESLGSSLQGHLTLTILLSCLGLLL
nr:uncharacterized protein LOC115498426 [Taeniopygia guttata]